MPRCNVCMPGIFSAIHELYTIPNGKRGEWWVAQLLRVSDIPTRKAVQSAISASTRGRNYTQELLWIMYRCKNQIKHHTYL